MPTVGILQANPCADDVESIALDASGKAILQEGADDIRCLVRTDGKVRLYAAVSAIWLVGQNAT